MVGSSSSNLERAIDILSVSAWFFGEIAKLKLGSGKLGDFINSLLPFSPRVSYVWVSVNLLITPISPVERESTGICSFPDATNNWPNLSPESLFIFQIWLSDFIESPFIFT